jgi:acyl dehydratase
MGAGEHDFSEYIGMPTARGTIVVERAPVSQFAKAVLDDNAVYQNDEVAKANGFEGIPASPTFGFIAQNWGRWEELQPAPDPNARQPLMEVMGGLMSKGGLILHGEQEFIYHRPMVVGERLDFLGTVTDIYQKPTGDRTMTFLVTEDVYRDANGEPVLTSIMNLIHRS